TAGWIRQARLRRRFRWRDARLIARNESGVQRQTHGRVKRGINSERAAPTDGVEQILRQRPKDGAGEAAEQRQRGDCTPVRDAGDSVQRRKRWIVETGRARGAG